MNTPATDSREYHVSQPTPTPSAPEAIKLVLEQMEKFAPRYSAAAREQGDVERR